MLTDMARMGWPARFTFPEWPARFTFRRRVVAPLAAAMVTLVSVALEPPAAGLGTPTLDGAGVIAVGTYGVSATPNAVYLLDARTGQILHTLITGGADFAQSVFAGGWLFTANGNGVYAWGQP